MAKKQTDLPEELREAVFEAARAGAAEAYTQNTGYVNYFKAMETLLYNYKKLAALVADEEAYCEVEYHAGRKTFSTTPQAKGFTQRKTEAEIVEEMREEKQKQFKETKSGFDSLTRAISLFKGHKEFVVIRLYYFGEDINGNPREGGTATWEEIAEELSDAGILKEIKTARRWRNKIVNDMAVCVFGIAAAVGIPSYLLARSAIGNTGAMFLMMGVALPAFLLAMYEKDGLPFEKVVRNVLRARFLRPGVRPYQTENIYAPFTQRGAVRKEDAIAKSKKPKARPRKGR